MKTKILILMIMFAGISAFASDVQNFKMNPLADANCKVLLNGLWGKPVLDSQGHVQVRIKKNGSQFDIGVLTNLYNTYEEHLTIWSESIVGSRYMGIKFTSIVASISPIGEEGFILENTMFSGSTPDLEASDLAVLGSAKLIVTKSSADFQFSGKTSVFGKNVSCHFLR
jgi:hypothetical protein